MLLSRRLNTKKEQKQKKTNTEMRQSPGNQIQGSKLRKGFKWDVVEHRPRQLELSASSLGSIASKSRESIGDQT
jgi:hypothetical protein